MVILFLFGGFFDAFFCGTFFHALDAEVEVGVGGEELVHLARFLACGAVFLGLLVLERLEALEAQCHSPGVLAVALEELIAIVVGGFFLLLRVGGGGEGFAEAAELGVGERGGDIAGGCYGVFQRAGEERLLECFLAVLVGYVADFVADDAEEFVIAHDVHEGGEHANAAVGAGECVDVDDVVDLEVQGYTLNGCEAFGEAAEAFGVVVVLVGDGVVLVHPVNVFLDVGGHLFVGDGEGLYGFAGAFQQSGFVELGVGGCGYGKQQSEDGKAEDADAHFFIVYSL